MKKILIILGVSLLIPLVGICQTVNLCETLEDVPGMKQGIAYSFLNGEFTYINTIEVARYKVVSLEAGYSVPDKIIGAVSVEVLKLKDYIDLPILDLVEFNIGLYVGYERISLHDTGGNNEFDVGGMVSLINVKF